MAEDAGPQVAARPDHARQRRRGVLDAAVADPPVAVTVDRVGLPLAGVDSERPEAAHLGAAQIAAEVRLETRDRGKRPDAAVAEAVAGGGLLECVEIRGRHALAPGRSRGTGEHR